MLLMVVADITEQMTSRLATEQQSRFLDSLLAAIPSPVFYKDRNGRYLGCNEAFEKLIGKPRDQIIGRTAENLWPPTLSETYRDKDMELLSSPGLQKYEHFVHDASGRRRDMVFYKSTFAGPNHAVEGIVGVLLDITERKAAEEDVLRKSEINAAMAELATQLLTEGSIEDTSSLIMKKAMELTGSQYAFVGYVDQPTGNLISPTLSRGNLA